jgi:hypothetical protein
MKERNLTYSDCTKRSMGRNMEKDKEEDGEGEEG